jgi:pyrroloquinoline quinone biosynthesis protein D
MSGGEVVPGRPKLARRAILRHDEVRSADLLLLPERVIKLNSSGAAVLRLCDGRTTVAQILEKLKSRYDSPDEAEVAGFLARLAEQGALE